MCGEVIPVQLAYSNRIRVALGSLLVLVICSRLPAQEPQIDALADQMSDSLSHAKLKTVMVFDFVGPDETDALGQRLAADFRAALAKSAHGIQVEDRAKLLEILQQRNYGAFDVSTAETACWLLQQTTVEVSIIGKLSNGKAGLKISLQAFRVRDTHRVAKLETSMPLTEELQALVGKSEKNDPGSLPIAGKNGYSTPHCVSCPPAPFSEQAVEHKYQGTVLLAITVDENGNAKDIVVIKGESFGLTEKAIATVRRWRFKPATGTDGKPAAVRVRVEVTFHLY
jgi:TonB family protein